MHNNVCCAVKHKAKTICRKTVAGRATASESDFMFLYTVFHLSTATVGCFIKKRQKTMFEAGDKEAEVFSLCFTAKLRVYDLP